MNHFGIMRIITCGKRMVTADMMLHVMKSFHLFFTNKTSMAIGRPNSAANGQPTKGDLIVSRVASGVSGTYSGMWKVLW